MGEQDRAQPAALELVGDRERDLRGGRVEAQVDPVADRPVVLAAEREQPVAGAVVDLGHHPPGAGEVGGAGEEPERLGVGVEPGEQLLEDVPVVRAHRAQADGGAVVEDDVGLAVVGVGRVAHRAPPGSMLERRSTYSASLIGDR